MGLNNRNAHLESLLIFNAKVPGRITSGLCTTRGNSGTRADEVSCVDLNLFTPLRPHLLQCLLRVLQQVWVVDLAEADGYPGCIGDGMRPYSNQVRRVGAGGCSEDELESVFSVDFETGKFSGCVCKRRWYSCKALSVAVNIEGP